MDSLTDTVAALIQHRTNLERMAGETRVMREMVSSHSAQNPATAAYLISLFDQRLALLDEITTAHKRIVEIITSFGASSKDPVQEIEKLMADNKKNFNLLHHLIAESKKITPDTILRGEGKVQ